MKTRSFWTTDRLMKIATTACIIVTAAGIGALLPAVQPFTMTVTCVAIACIWNL